MIKMDIVTTVETIMIDGDLLESTFETPRRIHDRFSHVIICGMNGENHHIFLYIYVRNFPQIINHARTVSMNDFPMYQEHAINNELLVIYIDNVNIVVDHVQRRANTINDMYAEIRQLESVGLMDVSTQEIFQSRLIAHLKSIRLNKFDEGEGGIFWCPENYMFNEFEEEEDENEEQSVRMKICGQIKHRPLPMVNIPHLPNEEIEQMWNILNAIHYGYYQFHDEIQNHITKTHYVQIYRNCMGIPKSALNTLMSDEFRCVKNGEIINNESMFIFSDEQLDGYNKTNNTNDARKKLKYYVGDYFDELDLTRSFITGSAISACLINVNESVLGNLQTRENMIDILYPITLTSMDENHRHLLKNENIHLWNIRAISPSEGIATKSGINVPFGIKEGSDVDIAVDNTVTDDEYRQIAASHFAVIQKYYPDIIMKEYAKPKGDWNYVIYTENLNLLPVFRRIEIYRSSFRNICSHHVGAVRGCYTSRWSEDPKFYITASALWTSMTGKTPNYHYFAGKKSNPQDIIIKNLQRGIGIADEILNNIIDRYMYSHDINISHLPFHLGRGVPYSIFSAHFEAPFYQQILKQRTQLPMNQARRNNRNYRSTLDLF